MTRSRIYAPDFVHTSKSNTEIWEAIKVNWPWKNQHHPQRHRSWCCHFVPWVFCTLSWNTPHLIFCHHRVNLLLSSPWAEIPFHVPIISIESKTSEQGSYNNQCLLYWNSMVEPYYFSRKHISYNRITRYFTQLSSRMFLANYVTE